MLTALAIIGMFVAWFLLTRAIYRELCRRARGEVGSNRHLKWYLLEYPERSIDDYCREYPDA